MFSTLSVVLHAPLGRTGYALPFFRTVVCLVLFLYSYTPSSARLNLMVGVEGSWSGKMTEIGIQPDPFGDFYYERSQKAVSFGLFLYPRYHVVKTKALSVSAGLPVGVGVNLHGQHDIDDNRAMPWDVAYSLPATVDVNFGRCAWKNKSVLGFFAGAGAGIQNITNPRLDVRQVSGPLQADVTVANRDEMEVASKTFRSGFYWHAGFMVGGPHNKFARTGYGLRFGCMPDFSNKSMSYYTISFFSHI